MRPIPLSQEAAMLAAFKNRRDQMFFLFGRYTGFRASELLSIRVADVWSGAAFLREITLTRKRLKGGLGIAKRRVRSRTLPLHPALLAGLQTHLDARFGTANYEPEAYLFPSRKGVNRPITKGQAWRIMKTAAEVLGDSRRIGTHSLRKSFARDVFESTGHNLILTQHALGHASVETTTAYLTPEREAVDAAILAIGPSVAAPTALSSPEESEEFRRIG